MFYKGQQTPCFKASSDSLLFKSTGMPATYSTALGPSKTVELYILRTMNH